MHSYSLKIPSLIKWRLSLAVAFSATAGYFLEERELSLNSLVCFLGVFLLAGGSAGLNQIQERRLDQLMARTEKRPLPTREMTVIQALIYTLLFVLAGSILLFRLDGLAAGLGLLNLLIYNGIYTPLKRKTLYALLPGGLVGAIPPLIGWTAAGGDLVHPNILYLSTLLFLWQIPHFWLLVIRHGKEYESAGFQSISLYLDEKQIKRLVFFWISLSSVFLASFSIFGIQLNLIIAGTLIVLNAVFILAFYWYLFKVQDPSKIKPAFILTNLFLTLVLLLLIVNSLL